MKKPIFKPLMFAGVAYLAASGVANASVSDVLDDITADAAFTYTGGDSKKLSQIGRHAFSFGRIRFSNPTTAVNVVNLVPPSISAPNCSSININLGSFDIISLDEAVAILRRVASEALTYGFGLALQSMCSPCWTSMKTLQNQLERLNLANRNTCTMVKSYVDQWTDNGEVFDLTSDICEGEGAVFGKDSYLCKLEDSSAAKNIQKGYDRFIDIISAKAGDPTAHYTWGNLIAELFKNAPAGAVNPNDLFPSDLSTLILGKPESEGDTGSAHPGISPTEAAMNLFGYFRHAPDGDNENAKSNYIDASVTSLTKLLDADLACDGVNCRKISQCEDVTVENPDTGESTTFLCGTGFTTKPDYTAAITEYTNNEFCTDKASKVTLRELLRCQVQATFKKLEEGQVASLTDLQKKVLQSSPPAVIRAFSIGTAEDKAALAKSMNSHITDYLTMSMVYNFVTDLGQMTSSMIVFGLKEMNVKERQIAEIRNEIDKKLSEAAKLKTEGEAALARLEASHTFNELSVKYATSMSREVTNNLNKQN